MKKILTWAKDNWVKVFLYILSLSVIVFVSIYNLESITSSKLSLQEIGSLESAKTISGIINNPLYAPFKIVEYLVINMATGSIYLLRLVAALYGIATVILFYFLSKYWFSPLIAWLSTMMFATGTLYLHHSRLAVTSILVPLLLLAILWATWYTNKAKNSNVSIIIFIAILSISLYVPGIIWFILLALFLQKRHLLAGLRNSSWIFLTLSILLGLIFILPLLYAFYVNSSLILDWLALPNNFNVKEIIKNIIRVPMALTIQSQPDPIFNLGRLPIIDILTLALMVLGSYAYGIRLKLMRTRTLILASIISWLLIAFNKIDYAILLPFIYLLAAGGIMFLLQQWYSVFPKNPIARSSGLLLVIIVISISIFYNIDRYFVAWQHNPATVESFNHPVPTNLVQ